MANGVPCHSRFVPNLARNLLSSAEEPDHIVNIPLVQHVVSTKFINNGRFQPYHEDRSARDRKGLFSPNLLQKCAIQTLALDLFGEQIEPALGTYVANLEVCRYVAP